MSENAKNPASDALPGPADVSNPEHTGRILEPNRRLITAHIEGLFGEIDGVVGDLRCSAFRKERGKDVPFYTRPLEGRGFVNGHHSVTISDDPQSVADAITLLHTVSEDAARAPTASVICPPPVLFAAGAQAKLENIVYAPAFVIDADDDPAACLREVEGLLGPATWVVESGSTFFNRAKVRCEPKLHIYYRLEAPACSPAEIEVLRGVFRGAALRFRGADKSITPAHPLRLWGSVNTKKADDPRICHIVEDRSAVRFDLGDLERKLAPKAPRKAVQPQIDAPLNPIEPPAALPISAAEFRPAYDEPALIAAILGGKDYHDGLLRIAYHRVRAGAAPAETIDYLERLMDNVPVDRRDGGEPGRWAARRADIRRMVMDAPAAIVAREGEAPGVEAPDMTLLLPERAKPPELPKDFFLPLAPGANSLLQTWVTTAAEAKGAPPDYVIGAVLATAAGVMPHVTVRIHADWDQPLVLWCALVGEPSAGKSPALNAVLKPLATVEDEVRQRAQALHHAWLKAKSDAEAGGVNFDEPEPVVPDLSVTNATIEKLGMIVAAQRRGLLLPQHELAGLLANFSRHNRGDDRDFWLAAYDAEAAKVRRVTREDVTVSRLPISIAGCIQPGRLHELLLQSVDDGLAARFMMFFPDPSPVGWPVSVIDNDLMAAALRGLQEIPDNHILHLDDGARDEILAVKVWARGEEGAAEDVVRSAIGKSDGRVARIAGVLTLLHWALDGDGPVPTVIGKVAVQRARIFVQTYSIPMLRRVVGDTTLPSETRGAQRLARMIVENSLETITTRDVQRRGRKHLQTTKEVTAAIGVLVQGGWLSPEAGSSGPRGGRPVHRWRINPRVFELAKGFVGSVSFRGPDVKVPE